MDRITLTITGWIPERLNVLLRSHWRVRAKATERAAKVIGTERFTAGIPFGCEERRRVSVVYSQPTGQADADARWKVLLDGLVGAGLLHDDSPAWCELGTVETVRGELQTVVTLEPAATPSPVAEVVSPAMERAAGELAKLRAELAACDYRPRPSQVCRLLDLAGDVLEGIRGKG